MTSLLIWPSGERERVVAGTALSDLERSAPGIFLQERSLTDSPPRSHHQLSYIIEDNKTYYVRGHVEESQDLREQVTQLERTVDSLRRALDRTHRPKSNNIPVKFPTVSTSKELLCPPESKQEKEEESPTPPPDTRQRVVDEIIHSEGEYLKELHLITSIFHQHFVGLSKQPNPPIHSKVVHALFGDLPGITKMNNKFLSKLKEDPEGHHVGDSFLAFREAFEGYCTFIGSHDERIRLLQTLRSKTKTREILEEIEQTKAVDLGDRRLSDLLIHPVKRVPQYIILLQRLLKHTPVAHGDYGRLEEAVGQYQELATLFDENSQHVADARTVLTLMNSFRIPKKFMEMKLINTHRVFRFDVDRCQVVLPGKALGHYRACVFNDCILFLTRSRRSMLFGPEEDSHSVVDRVCCWVVRYWLQLDRIQQVRFIEETHTVHVTMQTSCLTSEPVYIHAEGRELQSWRNYFDSRVIGPRTRSPTRKSTPKLPRSRSVVADKRSSMVMDAPPLIDLQVHSSDSIRHRRRSLKHNIPSFTSMAKRSQSACEGGRFRLSPRKLFSPSTAQ